MQPRLICVRCLRTGHRSSSCKVKLPSGCWEVLL